VGTGASTVSRSQYLLRWQRRRAAGGCHGRGISGGRTFALSTCTRNQRHEVSGGVPRAKAKSGASVAVKLGTMKAQALLCSGCLTVILMEDTENGTP
jgi:hypothetical protein